MQIPDKCSFDWAKKLAEAGYKAPAYGPGQLYYDRFGRPVLIGAVFASGVFEYMNLKSLRGGRVDQLRDGEIYAPGVEELMRDVSLNGYYSPEVHYSINHKDYRVTFDEFMDSVSKNLCDALAEAWIENRKNTAQDEKA